MTGGDDTGPTAGAHRQRIGDRIRALRAERGLSLAELGQATGISSSFLSLVEQGRSDITIGRLLRLAAFFGVHIAEVVVGSTHAPTDSLQLLRPGGDAMVVQSHSEGVDVFVLAQDVSWTLVPVLAVHQAGSVIMMGPSPGMEVVIWVLEGTFEVAIAGEAPTVVREGEGAIYRADRPYSVRNVGDGGGRVLAIAAPAETR